jgi:Bacterial SH3 domain.
MKKVAIVLCLFLLIMTMSACRSTSETNSDGNAAEVNGTEEALAANPLTWHNLEMDIDALSERERIIADFFYTDYIDLDYSSFDEHAQMYENANISIPLVIAKIISSNEETYEAIAILVNWEEFYDFHSALDSLIADNYALSGRQLIYISGNQTNPYGEPLSEYEVLRMYGKYNGMVQKEIDGESLNMFSLSVNQYVGYGPFGFRDSISKYSYETVARALFENDITLETCNGSGGHTFYYAVTPDNQNNIGKQSFLLGGVGEFLPIDKSLLLKSSYDGLDFEINSDDVFSNKNCSVSPDFDHLLIADDDETLKKLSVAYCEINTFNKIWGHEFDNVGYFSYDFTIDNVYMFVDDKLHIVSIEDGSIINDPIYVGHIVDLKVQPDGILLVRPSQGDNLAKIDFDGNILWSIKIDNFEISDSRGILDSYKTTRIQNTGEHYVIQANSMQRAAVSYAGEVLSIDGDLTPTQKYEMMLDPAYQLEANRALASDRGEPLVIATVKPKEGLNLRESPSAESSSLLVLEQGSFVEIITEFTLASGAKTGWAHVGYTDENGAVYLGYVSTDFLSY